MYNSCYKILFLIGISILGFTANSYAQQILVDQLGGGDYITVQEGIDAAQDGDTILVYPGIYFENIDFAGKNIRVCSRYLFENDEWFIHNTVLDGNRNGSVVKVANGEQDASICGFTIQNGTGADGYVYGTDGGGIFCWETKLSVHNCIIKDNFASTVGGGIYCWGAELTISGNRIFNNHSLWMGGGIALIDTSRLVLDTINLNSIYLNFSGRGCDLHKAIHAYPLTLVVDTFTVANPDHYYISSTDTYGNQQHDIEAIIQNAKIDAVNVDLFVSPSGDNSNSGLTALEPLKSVSFALSKIVSDSLHPNSIRMANGIYSPSLTGEFFPLNVRSYISFEGESKQECIWDAEYTASHLLGNKDEKNMSFNQFTLTKGYGNIYNHPVHKREASVRMYDNQNITFRNLIFTENESSLSSAMHIGRNSNFQLFNTDFISNHGGAPLRMGDSREELQTYRLENIRIALSSGGVIDPEIYGGVAILLIGNAYYLHNMYVQMVNVEITENSRDYQGPSSYSGMQLLIWDGTRADIINATISNNSVLTTNVATIHIGVNAEANFYNTIIHNPEMPLEILIGTSLPGYLSTMSIHNSLLRGGEELIYEIGPNEIVWGELLLDTIPMFENQGPFPYKLAEGSPCINLGTPMNTPGMEPPYIVEKEDIYYLITTEYDSIPLPATDLAGNPRIIGDRIDMGAYESQDGVFIQKSPPQKELRLSAYPNPFTNQTTIAFSTKKQAHIIAEIYNLKGRKIQTLMDATTAPCKSKITWKGCDDFGEPVPTGTYICRLIVNNTVVSEVKVVKIQK